MAKVNNKPVDFWSIPHFVIGYIMGRYQLLDVYQFTAGNIGWEIFETAVLKKHYDIFNIPFGKDTVLESKANTFFDLLITEAGYLLGYSQYYAERPVNKFVSDYFDYPITAVEIGVFRGGNSVNMLKSFPIEHLYLIDPYEAYKGYEKESLMFPFLPKSFEYVLNKIWNSGFPVDNITPIQMMSEDAVDYIPNDIDFIYIDGNHAYEYVKKDVELYYPKLKSGGILGGHDFVNMGLSGDIQRAVYELADEHNMSIYAEKHDWWVIKP
jgi:hypothetical protein